MNHREAVRAKRRSLHAGVAREQAVCWCNAATTATLRWQSPPPAGAEGGGDLALAQRTQQGALHVLQHILHGRAFAPHRIATQQHVSVRFMSEAAG